MLVDKMEGTRRGMQVHVPQIAGRSCDNLGSPLKPDVLLMKL